MNIILFILFLVSNFFTPSDSVTVNSEIKEVTVFRKQAQIQRQTKVDLQAGKNVIVFEQLSPTLIQNSIQFKANGEFTVLSITQRYNYFGEVDTNPKVKKLEQQRDSIQQEITFLDSDLNVIQREIRLLDGTTSIIDNNELTAAELTQFLDLYRSRATKLEKEQISFTNRIQSKRTQLNKINAQIRELRNWQRERFTEVIAEVNSDQTQTLTFTLNYLVRSAGWTPSYDIRSKDISKPLSINYKAEVYQNSGIDWDDVNLTINSGNPSANATLPVISPNYVDFVQNRHYDSGNSYANIIQTNNPGTIQGRVVESETGEPLVGVSIHLEGTNQGTSTDGNGNFILSDVQNGTYNLRVNYIGYSSLQKKVNLSNSGVLLNVLLSPEMLELDEIVVVSGYAEDRNSTLESKKALPAPPPVEEMESQTSFSYTINTPYSVPSDGKTHSVEIKRADVSTEYSYATIPKHSKYAYLMGKISDWGDLNLIAGEANIYFENSFIGSTRLNPNSFDDTLSVSLGRDESIIIERTKLREFEERNFFRNKVREKNAWEINIRNTKSESITINVQDQIPISRNEDISVEANRLSDGEINKQTGIITWKLNIAPNSSEKLRIDYQVEYPSDQQIRY